VVSEERTSRQRRFLIPELSGWEFDIDFTLTEPLGVPLSSLTNLTQIIACVPFTFKMDSIVQ
jgi:hypothetical protein